jgi:hypothetical protein
MIEMYIHSIPNHCHPLEFDMIVNEFQNVEIQASVAVGNVIGAADSWILVPRLGNLRYPPLASNGRFYEILNNAMRISQVWDKKSYRDER